jgi:hypothetical protein
MPSVRVANLWHPEHTLCTNSSSSAIQSPPCNIFWTLIVERSVDVSVNSGACPIEENHHHIYALREYFNTHFFRSDTTISIKSIMNMIPMFS